MESSTPLPSLAAFIAHRAADGPAGAGLVSSAITEPTVHGVGTEPHSADDATVEIPDDASELARAARGMFAFPRADLVHAAAGMFPEPSRTQHDVQWGHLRKGGESEFAGLAEGSWPRVEIAPGLVRFARVDLNRAERAQERVREDRARLTDWMVNQARKAAVYGPQERPAAPPTLGTRGGITSWSAKSRARMIAAVSSLDLAGLIDSGTPAMLTLTLPGDWLVIAPNAEAASAVFKRFVRAYEKKWGKLRTIWKREFQRRGAPHWHLWLVPPSDPGFRRWVRYAWTTAMQVPRPADRHPELAPDTLDRRPCVCSEWCRSINAGTGLDIAEGMRATDPRRLAVYFLKESGIGEGKAYQNDAPVEWSAWSSDLRTRKESRLYESVGRFWGVRGLDKALAVVEISPEDQYAVWRVIRKVRESQSGVRKITRWTSVFDPQTGELLYRKKARSVNRRVRVRAAAGWVAVNDGAAFGEQLGRYATQLSEQTIYERELLDRLAAKRATPLPPVTSTFWG